MNLQINFILLQEMRYNSRGFKFIDWKWMMVMIRLSWLISLAISFFGFLIVNQLFGVQPEGASGNLGFIGMIFLIPFVLLSLFTTFRYFFTVARPAKKTSQFAGIFGGFLLIGLFFYFLIGLYQSNEVSLFELNKEAGQFYFDIYTFGLIHSISGVLGALVGALKPEKMEKSQEPHHDS